VRPAIYIPNFNGARHLPRVLGSLRDQSREVEVVIADNGSGDESVELVRESFPEVEIVELGANLGFGTAINRAVAGRPADPVILLNSDVECEPRFVEALLDAHGGGSGSAFATSSVAGVLLQEASPGLIDSAGVVADVTLMGFDHLHGEPVASLATAPPPLGPTGGAALYELEAFRSVDGFDERIFLYYEDLDLALRLAAAGVGCRLAPDARAIHAYSAGLGAGSGGKYAHTGWSRGYMLHRYGVMSSPGRALRSLACEMAICAGQLAIDHTAKGLSGRLRGWRDGGGLPRRELGDAALLDIPAREALRRRRQRRG